MRNTGNQVGKVSLSHLCGQSQGPSQSNVEIEREKKEMQTGKETKCIHKNRQTANRHKDKQKTGLENREEAKERTRERPPLR